MMSLTLSQLSLLMSLNSVVVIVGVTNVVVVIVNWLSLMLLLLSKFVKPKLQTDIQLCVANTFCDDLTYNFLIL